MVVAPCMYWMRTWPGVGEPATGWLRQTMSTYPSPLKSPVPAMVQAAGFARRPAQQPPRFQRLDSSSSSRASGLSNTVH